MAKVLAVSDFLDSPFRENVFLIALKRSPVGLFYAIFRLIDFSSDAFEFSSSKTG